MKPNIYEIMSDCDTKKECTNKRLRKSYDNSFRFMDACIEEHRRKKGKMPTLPVLNLSAFQTLKRCMQKAEFRFSSNF